MSRPRLLTLWLPLLATVLACGDDGSVAVDGDSSSGTADGTTSVADGSTSADESGAACGQPFALECPADQSLACMGPSTPVSVSPPDSPCEEWMVVGEGPTSLPPGEHPVEFELQGEGMSTSCVTTITVVDDAPPYIDCPDAGTLVLRSEPGIDVAAPALSADDLCWDELEITTDPAVLPSGVVDVEYTATDGSGNAASCTTQIEVVDVFAVEGFRLISATLDGAGQTEITLAWEPSPAAIVTGYRIETAPDPGGPWTTLDTVGSGEQLYSHTLGASTAWFRVVTESSLGDGGTTAPRRAFAVTDELYDIRNVAITGIPFATTLYGVVRYPTALGEGPFPLVLAMHGNHGNCRDPFDANSDYCSTSNDHECADPSGLTTPNAEGYNYFLDTLAAQGYVTVSISGNAMNCRNDFIIERARLITEHLRRWSDWGGGTGELGGLFAGTLDLDRVGLVGHSRGGDAASNVPGLLASTPIPGLTVRSVFAVAPTDFHDVVVRDTELAVLLPACDGDVADLQGLRHYDRSIGFDDGVEQAQVFYIGANHNFFNTEWRVSEWEPLPGTHPYCEPAANPQKLEQTHMLEATLGSWFASTLRDEPTEAFVRAQTTTPTAFEAWAGSELDLRWSYSSPDRVPVDDFTGPGTPNSNDVGGANSFSDWYIMQVCQATGCDAAYPHLRNSLRLLWEQGFTPLARFGLGGLDTAEMGTISFRVVSRLSTFNDGLSVQDFYVRVIDGNGVQVQFPLSDVKELRHLYPQTNGALTEVLETVRIPVALLLAYEPALDLSSLDAIELEMTALDRSGSVIITDLELAQ